MPPRPLLILHVIAAVLICIILSALADTIFMQMLGVR
jgi:hypothetical protein